MIDEAELTGYLDGELSAERCKIIENALAQDPHLRDMLHSLQATDALLLTSAQNLLEIADPQLQKEPDSRLAVHTVLITAVLILALVILKYIAFFTAPLIATLIEVVWLGITISLAIRIASSDLTGRSPHVQ